MGEENIYEFFAREAYHAYGEVTDFKNYQGLPMPKWEDLTDKIREAWIAAATKVSILRSRANLPKDQ